ncbi:MAG: hypothetical protein Q9187_000427 [Circinaria calcarea]
MHPFTIALILITLSELRTGGAAPFIANHQASLTGHAAGAGDIRAAHSLSLSYPSTHASVRLGNHVSPSSVSSPPTFEIHPLTSPSSHLTPTRILASNATYTLILTDPDATSRADPAMAEMCHWILTGITLTKANASSQLEDGAYILELSTEIGVEGKVTELVEYLPPSPPPKTGDHRYVFVLLAPQGDEAGRKLTKPKDRQHWGYGKVGKGVGNWARENGLVAVGKLVLPVLEVVIEDVWKNSNLTLK